MYDEMIADGANRLRELLDALSAVDQEDVADQSGDADTQENGEAGPPPEVEAEVVEAPERRTPDAPADFGALLEPLLHEVWHSPYSEAYATEQVDNHLENLPVSSSRFASFLQKVAYQNGRTLRQAALDAVVATLDARGLFGGPEYKVYVRVAGDGGKLYVDLGNPKWEAIEIDAEGYRIKERPPVKFQRSAAMSPLPYPVQNGNPADLERLKVLLNLPDDDDTFALVLGFLLNAFNPAQCHLVLALVGGQGSGKSTLARLIGAFLDPSSVPTQGVPRSDEDLLVAAENSFLPNFDNLSGLSNSLSDTFCRLSTRGGFRRRRRYTDREEATSWGDATRHHQRDRGPHLQE